MSGNTVIQLKWSDVTYEPPSLNVAEPAYSLTAHKLYIGDPDLLPVPIGGYYYTYIIDSATNHDDPNSLVQRDVNGDFDARIITSDLYGNSNTASAWLTPRQIGVSGDANGTIAIDGTTNANIPLVLGNTGVIPGAYGSLSQIPTFTVDSKGRISTITINTIITANASANGYLSSTDWNTFNSKQKTITFGTADPSGGSDGDIYLQYT